MPIDTCKLALKKFLEAHYRDGPALLLGYSGGPDSKALLYQLLECRHFFPGLRVEIAHLDHGWRDESRSEAEQIRSEIEGLGLIFHTMRSSPLSHGNWEEQGRRQRLTFFHSIYHSIQAQALILGHHADDHAETVLKRLFEGAHIRHLGGMTPVSRYEQMVIWRPFLNTSKSSLSEWVKKRGLTAIDDPSNRDLCFTRSRMREEIIPWLSLRFGKQIADNLCLMGQSAHELADYFSRKLSPVFQRLQENDQGYSWVLHDQSLEKVEWDYLIRQWLQEIGESFSREGLSQIVDGLMQRKVQRTIPLKKGEVSLVKGDLFYARRL